MSFKEIIQSNIPVLIDFYAEWCGPCKAFSPIVQEVKNELGDEVKVFQVDVDTNEDLATRLQVLSIPTVMIYKNGELRWRDSGLQSKKTLLSKISEIANN